MARLGVFLLAALLAVQLLKANGEKGCKEDETEMECDRDVVKCVPRKYLCDGKQDCPTGSDEAHCEPETPAPPPAPRREKADAGPVPNTTKPSSQPGNSVVRMGNKVDRDCGTNFATTCTILGQFVTDPNNFDANSGNFVPANTHNKFSVSYGNSFAVLLN